MPSADLQLQAHASNVSNARRFVRETLADWDGDDLTMSAELVVSELVSNSVLHARSPLRVRLTLDDSGLLVEVRDQSPSEPVRRRYAIDATTGRGLGLVAALTDDDWGCRPDGDGKVVWARIPADESSRGGKWDMADDVDVTGADDPARSGRGTAGASALAA